MAGNRIEVADATVHARARRWIEEQWDPALPLGEWWQVLADSGWGFPTWPLEWRGKGLSHPEAKDVRRAFASTGAMPPPHGVGTLMVVPTLLELGEDALLERFLPSIANGVHAWCQLFSEPNAGSDLAGVQTRAVRSNDGWVVNGQKVWTSAAHSSDFGVLLARTDPEVPKHHGLSFFVIDMRQPGVEVRPLRQMNGLSEFDEVFLTDARVPLENIVGSEGDGWRIALTLLNHERASIDADRESTAGLMNRLDLNQPAGSYIVAEGRETDTDPSGLPVGARARNLVIEAVRTAGLRDEPIVRQQVARVITLIEIASFSAGRLHPSLAKNLTTTMLKLLRDCTLAAQGATGMLAGDDALFEGIFQRIALTLPGLCIAGGSEEIQRNIIGERLLGLPSEPRVDKDVPFSQVPRQAIAR